MTALGKFVEFTELKDKGLSVTNDDMRHGVVVSVGADVPLKLKKGDKIIVSTVKKVQDVIDGETHYFVQYDSVVAKL